MITYDKKLQNLLLLKTLKLKKDVTGKTYTMLLLTKYLIK